MLASALPAGSGTADAMAVGQQQRHAPALNRDPCTICTKSVFHSERARIPVEGLSTELLMHRDCFRCSRCRRPLSLASFYCCVEDGQIPLLFCPDHKPRATAGLRGIAKHAKTVTVAASVFSPPKPKPQPRQQPAAGFAHIAPPEEASKAMRSERAPFAATNAPAEPAGRAPRAAARTLGARPAMPAARKLDTASAPSPTHQLKLNSASADELMQLPGVGRQLAAKIVAHRNQHGPFVSVGGLMAVSGIGSLLFKKLEPLICLSD